MNASPASQGTKPPSAPNALGTSGAPPLATTTPGLVVWGMPPVWGMPSASPFCLKLETWLRMAALPYTPRYLDRPPRSSTGKVPYVELPSGELLADSSLIIAELTRTHGVQLDAALTPTQRGQAVALQRLVEDHLYFALAWERWHEPAGWAETKVAYFAHVPAFIRWMVPPIARRGVLRALHGHGIGRLRPEEVVAAGCADIDALALCLGEGPYFFGGEPTTTDAVVYGALANLHLAPLPTALQARLRGHASLVAWVERMRGRYWGEG